MYVCIGGVDSCHLFVVMFSHMMSKVSKMSFSLFCFDKSTDDVDDTDDDEYYYYYYCRGGGGALSTRGWCLARVRFSFKCFSKRV